MRRSAYPTTSSASSVGNTSERKVALSLAPCSLFPFLLSSFFALPTLRKKKGFRAERHFFTAPSSLVPLPISSVSGASWTLRWSSFTICLPTRARVWRCEAHRPPSASLFNRSGLSSMFTAFAVQGMRGIGGVAQWRAGRPEHASTRGNGLEDATTRRRSGRVSPTPPSTSIHGKGIFFFHSYGVVPLGFLAFFPLFEKQSLPWNLPTSGTRNAFNV